FEGRLPVPTDKKWRARSPAPALWLDGRPDTLVVVRASIVLLCDRLKRAVQRQHSRTLSTLIGTTRGLVCGFRGGSLRRLRRALPRACDEHSSHSQRDPTPNSAAALNITSQSSALEGQKSPCELRRQWKHDRRRSRAEQSTTGARLVQAPIVGCGVLVRRICF